MPVFKQTCRRRYPRQYYVIYEILEEIMSWGILPRPMRLRVRLREVVEAVLVLAGNTEMRK